MRSLYLTAAAALFASVASAQTYPSSNTTAPVRVGFAGGVIVPRSGASVATLKTGVHGQGFVLFQLAGLPPLRLNADYARMKFDRTPLPGTSVPTTNVDADRTIIDGVASMQIDLVKGPVRPYVLAGVGAFNVKDVVDAASSTSASQSFSTTNFGVDGGAGVAIRIGRLDAFVETRLQNVYTKQHGLIDTKSITAFPVSFGVTF